MNKDAVAVVPGASAGTAALSVAGLPTDRFVFEGFLPPKKGRQKRLQGLKEEARTLIFYESPHKLLKTLDQFQEVFGPDREVSVSRELSKLYGETIRGTLATVVEYFKEHTPKGEFVLVLRGAAS